MALNEDIKATTPLIFYEFSEGTDEERDELLQNLRNCKTFTRIESKEAWYAWRAKLLTPLLDSLKDNIELLGRVTK